MLKGVITYFLRLKLILRSMWWIWLNKLSNFLLKLSFLFIISWRLTDLTCIITWLKCMMSWRNIFNMFNMMFIFLENRQSQHLIFEIILLILRIVIHFRERIMIFINHFLMNLCIAWFWHELNIFSFQNFIFFL